MCSWQGSSGGEASLLWDKNITTVTLKGKSYCETGRTHPDPALAPNALVFLFLLT